ncbi:histidine phosphatase family protein [Paenibacillus albiflavus]|uniref:Histidine phosphatase family protein n=1 Tax=Paenibacillus albiflavus TaxID=2545760 RepID=A0A4R4EJ07_9BACL|nr:histidine phosphatase family protein [Paenibacillus albiflavus]TCZ78218.1 histidine phosphatase family protein [Paenibacillus albiflavus]
MRLKKNRWIWLFIVLLLVIPMNAAAAAEWLIRPVNPSILDPLRQGGYILYVRHGEANVGDDMPNLNFDDCRTQRNLSEEGRRQALLFGESLRNLRIPFQFPVQASPFCRTRESAALAFGESHVQVDPFWYRIYKLSNQTPPAEQANTLAALRTKLETIPPPGTNQVIFAHSFPEGLGLGEIPYLGTVVVKPKGQGNGYDIVGRIFLDEWAGFQ